MQIFSDFLYFWGIVFMTTTTLVFILKSENKMSPASGEKEHGIVETYHLLWKIVKLPSAKSLIVILLTCKVIKELTFIFFV